MKPSKDSLKAKRLAAIFFRKADINAAEGYAWSPGNVRTYQRFGCDALKERNKIIASYLQQRAER